MTGLPEDDDELIAELRRSIAGEARPEVSEILKQIPSFVSPLDSKGTTISDTTAELSGARDGSANRQLVVDFDHDLLTFEINAEGEITGQIPEAWQGANVSLETLLGPLPLRVDDFGLFRHSLGSTGPFRITATSDAGLRATDWLLR